MKIRKLLRDKRAMSVAITSVIMTGAVITLGFVVLNWASFRSDTFNKEFSDVIDENLDRLKEKVLFEYVYYNSSSKVLFVYVLNFGSIDDVNITTVFVTDMDGYKIGTYHHPAILSLSDVPMDALDASEEGYFKVENIELGVEDTYNLRIITRRGVRFDEIFIA